MATMTVKRPKTITTIACAVGLVATLAAPSRAQVTRVPSILAQAAEPQRRNILVLYYDDAFLFVGRHYGDGRDFAGPTEPGLFVHSKAHDRWIQITAISTVDGRFGKSSLDMLVSVTWDFTPFAQRPYIEQPLRAGGSLMFPDRIQYDSTTGRYELGHASSSGIASAETVLYILRADLIEAFARARRTDATVPSRLLPPPTESRPGHARGLNDFPQRRPKTACLPSHRPDTVLGRGGTGLEPVRIIPSAPTTP